jgi:hypothetical protein
MEVAYVIRRVDGVSLVRSVVVFPTSSLRGKRSRITILIKYWVETRRLHTTIHGTVNVVFFLSSPLVINVGMAVVVAVLAARRTFYSIIRMHSRVISFSQTLI